METLRALGFRETSRPLLLVHPERALRLHLCKSTPRRADGTESTALLEELVQPHPLGPSAPACLLLLGAAPPRVLTCDDDPRDGPFASALRAALRALEEELTSAGPFAAAHVYLERRRCARQVARRGRKKQARRAAATAVQRMLSAAGIARVPKSRPNATSDVRGMARALGAEERSARAAYADERRREQAARDYHPQRMLARGVFHDA